jgi:hypothetical protein
MQDKNGTEIRAGDTLFNPHDRDQYHKEQHTPKLGGYRHE